MSNKSSYRQQPQRHNPGTAASAHAEHAISGAWAVLLSRYSCENQVVYGCGVSGRPVDLGSRVNAGVFINTCPFVSS